MDLLVHEVFMASEDAGLDEAFLRRLEISHTVPSALGRVLVETRPVMAVTTHIGADNAPPERIADAIREVYDDRFLMGVDLMTFEIGDSVEVRRRD